MVFNHQLVFPSRRHHSSPSTAAALIDSIDPRGFPSPVRWLLTPRIPRPSTTAYSPTAARLWFAGATTTRAHHPKIIARRTLHHQRLVAPLKQMSENRMSRVINAACRCLASTSSPPPGSPPASRPTRDNDGPSSSRHESASPSSHTLQPMSPATPCDPGRRQISTAPDSRVPRHGKQPHPIQFVSGEPSSAILLTNKPCVNPGLPLFTARPFYLWFGLLAFVPHSLRKDAEQWYGERDGKKSPHRHT
jgi:hypothetical protein